MASVFLDRAPGIRRWVEALIDDIRMVAEYQDWNAEKARF